MDIFPDGRDEDKFLYLTRQDVVACCAAIDITATVAESLVAHAKGETLVPPEAYMGWETTDGHAARCLAMPGGIGRGGKRVLGLKVINASLGNPARGLPRSQGFTMLFDPQTSRPLAVMEAAYISASRTAAVTMLAARHLGPPGMSKLALIGCGTLARAHLVLLASELPGIEHVSLFDMETQRAQVLARAVQEDSACQHIKVTAAADVRECVQDADVVVPVTTTTEGYLSIQWLKPGAVIAHVSLDDVLPDVVEGAALVLVDDWDLVSQDDRRLLGRMYRDGRLLGPDGGCYPGTTPGKARQVDGTIGEVLLGVKGRRKDSDIILSNPFGMSILDVALAADVHSAALAAQLGSWLSF